ncbi:hypothetical protein SAMN04244553_4798 [Nocardia amikacinitolerans]|uniref:Uncharacterized protein n=1 Tax=Nocardia amikacinitolerans TaxID=756689 RepID=A0A285LSF1_9NOCA|nr:hypothetical protein [Nocardia amikacinitolerans]MCP2280012.1 hypothetical protein [Nocardia amikacinitolerans]MCP2295718.1 hypothetical protein [Nocardia amikacinitolerans]SNY87839.1 hypothetical protein SAMN04244553_4798 [Nocardia amikacinitolerans]
MVEHALWERMPTELRSRFDELIHSGRKIHAIQAVRESLPDPCPGIHECVDLLEERWIDLGRP